MYNIIMYMYMYNVIIVMSNIYRYSQASRWVSRGVYIY